MTSLRKIPEIAALRSGQGVIRIPPETDVPLTPRVRRLIDTSAFRRLSRVSQLGLVRHVYPAANHSRQEHSLVRRQLRQANVLDRMAIRPMADVVQQRRDQKPLGGGWQVESRSLWLSAQALFLFSRRYWAVMEATAVTAAHRHRPAYLSLTSSRIPRRWLR